MHHLLLLMHAVAIPQYAQHTSYNSYHNSWALWYNCASFIKYSEKQDKTLHGGPTVLMSHALLI